MIKAGVKERVSSFACGRNQSRKRTHLRMDMKFIAWEILYSV